ncbi:MAG: argininosuccinate synthase, partial [Candidatus Nitrosopelagicus sp.]|nr:argininosuccinate synthase [Candidatus Nitrosopelagicus sp.]
MKKIVLAYSGGLDTSIILKWLQENYKAEVIAYTADIGQEIDRKKIVKNAKNLGVKKIIIKDLKDTFVKDYVYPMIRGHAIYEGVYLLGTSIARPLIAKDQIRIAKKYKAYAVSHGATGKGNDQVRFDNTLRSGSNLPIIAPIRDMNLDRETELKFANKHGIEIDTVAKKFSIDQNLWGRAIEGGVLENPFNEPPDDAFIWIKTKNLPEKPAYLKIKFVKGVPTEV